MRIKPAICYIVLLVSVFSISCRNKIKQQEDQLYSRHLQEHVKLTIISTPVPDDKSQLNLLLLNDGQDAGKWGIKKVIDSLFSKKAIAPLLVVAIHSPNRMEDYGVEDFPDYQNRGSKAGYYAAFIDDELYPFIKKKAGVRKFNSVAIAGCSLGGLSAFDIAWNHADKIDKVGVFSGSFWWRNKDAEAKDYSDEQNRIMLNKIRSSRKKPKLEYWFYAGGQEETSDRDHDGVIDVGDDTRDLVALIKTKNVCPDNAIRLIESKEGKHDYPDWQHVLPDFLQWAFPK